MRKPILPVPGDQASIPGVNRVLSSKDLRMFFVCKWKFSEKHTFFSRSFKTVISSTNSGSHCLSRKCRTYTFNNFSLTKWESQNGGDLFGRAKIDTAKSCIQLLQIVLLYRGHLYKELCPGIFQYSKEWKKFTIEIVPKSAHHTHLTTELMLKQCAVYGSRPPIASKPGLSLSERYGLNNITSQPWSHATCPRTTSYSAYFRFVTLFSSKRTRQSTKTHGMGTGCVRL